MRVRRCGIGRVGLSFRLVVRLWLVGLGRLGVVVGCVFFVLFCGMGWVCFGICFSCSRLLLLLFVCVLVGIGVICWW